MMKPLPAHLPALLAGALLLAFASGCSTYYTTPGRAANLQAIGANDADLKERFETRAAAPFPARVAVIRVQDAGYHTYSACGFGEGRYCVVTTHDVEKDEDYAKLAALPQVAGLAAVNRLLLPPRLESVKDLRLACASLHADMLLLYTFGTSFKFKDHSVEPLTLVTLGFLPDQEAFITTTASAALYDVRTGYVYGIAEATETTTHLATHWSKTSVVDNERMKTETAAFAKLIDAFVKTWAGVVKEYGPKNVGGTVGRDRTAERRARNSE